MEAEEKPPQKPLPPRKPIEPEMPKGVENDQSSRTPDTEPPKDKRIDDV